MQQQRNEANDMFQRIANEVADQVSKKNHDYGNSYFRLRKEWGVQSFGVRLGDKYHRLANLLKGTEAQVDESIEDTIRDVIGYCLLELAYRERFPSLIGSSITNSRPQFYCIFIISSCVPYVVFKVL